MSSAFDIAAAQGNFVSLCCGVSATSLLVFEYMITVDREYQLVWKRRFTAATLFFLLNRYTVLLMLVLTLPTAYPMTSESCNVLGRLISSLQTLQSVLIAGFSSLRVYAISGRQWVLAWLVFILSLGPFTFDMLESVRQVPLEAPPPINCTNNSNISLELLNILIPVTRAAVVLADILVLAVTVQRTYKVRKITLEANLTASFSSVILRDGTLYFLVLLIINVMDIIFSVTQTFAFVGSTFLDPITAILISRFILNLRAVDPSGNGGSDGSRPSFVREQDASLRFAALSFIEPLGAPLDHGYASSAHECDISLYDGESLDEERKLGDVPGSSADTVVGRASTELISDAVAHLHTMGEGCQSEILVC